MSGGRDHEPSYHPWRHVSGAASSAASSPRSSRSVPSAELALIAAVPDDSTVLVALQAITGVAAGAGALTLFATAQLFGLLQASD